MHLPYSLSVGLESFNLAYVDIHIMVHINVHSQVIINLKPI